MTYQQALDILEISSSIEIVSLDIIKKNYRMKALLYHPDKNKSPDASSKFQEIHSAYDFLLKYNNYDENIDNIKDENGKTYQNLLFTFLKNIVGKESRSELFFTILQKLSNSCEEKTLKMLEQLDKFTLIKIYELAFKYWSVLHFGEGILEKIEKIIKEKTKNDECIILNPTLEDLFENNVYKLQSGDFIYIVPLWHHELVYDNSGNDVIVKCFPVLEDHIYIDDMNNIHVEITISIRELWNKEMYTVFVSGKEFNIIPKSLKLVSNQTVTFSKRGISLINTKDVYDVSKNSDLYIHLEITFDN